ncbi:MAG: ACT domain-containing protein [Phyllobacteriaceae bacterium]|jgi:hypothetical protein|nr:ACT domain-containing protein [Phyllobacteriaceae bacterium]
MALPSNSTPVADLETLMRSMSPMLDDRVFVFARVEADMIAALAPEAIMLFREKEGMTAIVEAATAQTHGLHAEFRCRMITLHVHSALDAVGFLAGVLPQLAQAGMGVNPVSAFFHDHLFIPEDRAQDAIGLLRALSEAGDA